MRDLSTQFLTELNSQESGDVIIWLLEATNNSIDPVYLASNTEDIVSNGRTYTAFPFKVTITPDDDDEAPVTRIDFSNIGLDLIERIRSVVDPIRFKLMLVLASDPDSVEVEIPDLIGRSLSYDSKQISYTLTYDDILSVVVPSHIYGPLEFGGLF